MHNTIAWFSVFHIIFLITGGDCILKENRESYIGAVVEYKAIGTPYDSTPEELLQKNCDNYISIIEEAALQNADIIVFPEYGLTTLAMPRDREGARPYMQFIPEIGQNPCSLNNTENNTVIKRLSCAAKSARIYVAVNLGEMRLCSNNETLPDDCPKDGAHHYSTTIVFDRSGTLISRYRKYRRFFEDQFESPLQPEISIFETDFGVKFGLMTSYDIVFDSPAVRLVEEGIKNIIFPAVWYDQLPFLTAIQALAMWAAGVNVNLLASGYHQPISAVGGQLGSGIFSGRLGPLNYTNDPESGTRVVLPEIPINPAKCSSSSNSESKFLDAKYQRPYHSFIREDLENYTTTVLDFADENKRREKVCNNDFCCSINFVPTVSLVPNSESPLNYRLVARNGTRKIAQGTHHFAWQVCGIVRCLNETLNSCTDHTFGNEDFAHFEFLEITGGPFHLAQVMQPSLNLLDVQFNIIPYDSFETYQSENGTIRIMSNLLKNTSIQTVAIIGRIYLSD